MNFTLEKVTSSGVRVGRLTKDGVAMATPLCLPHTRRGVTPFLTPDIVHGSIPHRPKAAMLTLSTLFHKPGTSVLNNFSRGIHNFFSWSGHILYMSVQDPSSPPDPSYNNTTSVSVWAPGGRAMVTPRDYMSFIDAFSPDIFESLCDTVSSIGQANKRIKKSVDRTLQFLDESLQIREDNERLKSIPILGAIEGSDVMEERIRSAKETTLRPVDGFVIEGFQLEHDKESLGDIISTVTSLLPIDKIRFINGIYRPSDIFKALESGIDVFDSSYAMKATEKGCALSYPTNINSNKAPNDESADAPPDPIRVFEIDLNDSKFKESVDPLVTDCTCYTCSNYSSAYVHHLLDAKEILANILLMVHNFTHIMTFYENLRESISNGTYEEFKKNCCQFCN